MNLKLTTHSSLRFILIFAQCFGMFPVIGITKEDCQFQWTSKRNLYSIIFTGSAIFNAIFFITKMVVEKSIKFGHYVTLCFNLATIITVILFIDISRKWPGLMKKWTEVDTAMTNYEFPKHLQRKLKLITVVIMSAAFLEHSLFLSVQFCSCETGYNFEHSMENFFKFRFDYIFEKIPYHPTWGIFLEILNIFSTISWNFLDLFIILISLCLSARFEQVTRRIQFLSSRFVTDEDVWQKIREDYTRLSTLTQSVDHVMSSVILLSFGNNILVILVQIFDILGTPPSYEILEKIYHGYSATFLFFRVTSVAMYASNINFESKKASHYLDALYNTEITRLLYQIKYNAPALTGHKLFRITRAFMLRVTIAIVTYELVLNEFMKRLLKE